MIRRAFIRRMIFAGLATWFLDLPLPAEASEPEAMRWIRASFPIEGDRTLSVFLGGPSVTGMNVGDRITCDVASDGRPLTGVVDYMTITAPGARTMPEMRALAGK